MIRNLMALPCMLALVLACGEARDDGQAGAAGGAGSESGALPADTGYSGAGIDDTTAAPSTDIDTAAPSDTSAATDTGTSSANQDQSGVTNTETGESELGDSAIRTTPDQGEPVTSKGDTIGVSGEGATSDTAQ